MTPSFPGRWTLRPAMYAAVGRCGTEVGALQGGNCNPLVYLDGMPMTFGGEPTGVDQLIRPRDVEAVEVDRGQSEVPARFGGANAGCGVLVIWSRVEH